MPIVLAAPASVDVVPTFQGKLMVWTGFDGSRWPLTGPDAVTPHMAPGVKGLHLPQMDVFESTTPLVPGSDLTGYSIPKRSVYWPLLFRARSVEDWASAYAGFFDSFHPVDPGIWAVGEGDEERTLALTGVFDGGFAFTRDPFLTGRALIGVELTAPRPLWRGKTIAKTFTSATGSPFIGEDGGPPFHLSPTLSFSTASIDNPGNEPSYLTWTIDGPMEEVTVGVGGAMITVPFDLSGGETLVIDTDPAGQYATRNGVDVTAELGFQMFAPVPARGTSPLSIAASGAGSIKASLVPLYWRAF